MDTGFNYYHGADPSEYDLVLSNSEGGPRAPARARRATGRGGALGRRPGVLPAAARREGGRRLLLRLRRQVPARVDGGAWSASRAGATRAIDFALGGRDFQGDVGARPLARRRPVQRLRARDLGGPDQPQRDASLARDRRRLVHVPPVRAGLGRRRDRLEPARRDRALVRARRASSSSSTTPTARSRPTTRCSTTRPRRAAMGARARERVLDEHTYAHRARQVLRVSARGGAR